MFKLEESALGRMKKVRFINAVLTLGENLVFLLIGRWDYTVLLGSVLGYVTATLFFYFICLSVPKALEYEDLARAKRHVATGRLARLGIIAAGVIIAFELDFINNIAALVPILFFTRLSIRIINLKGDD